MREGAGSIRRGAARAVMLVLLAGLVVGGCREQQTAFDASAPAGELLDEGWELVDRANWEMAARALNAVLDAPDATDDQKGQATYALAYVWQYRTLDADEARALALYRTVGEQYPDSDASPYATMALARSYDVPRFEENRDVPEARKLYREILDRWAEHVVADEAALWLGVSWLQELDEESRDRGAGILRDYLAKRPDNLVAAMMHTHLGRLHKDRRQWREAIAQFQQALKVDDEFATEEARKAAMEARGVPLQGERAGLCYQVARIAEKELRDYRLAIRYYKLIVNRIKRDKRYYVSLLGAERCREKLAASTRQAETQGAG